MTLKKMLVTIAYISCSSDFPLHFEDYWMCEHHTLGLSLYDPTFDLKQMYVTVTYVSWSSDFTLYLQDFDGWVPYFKIVRQCDPNFDLKINIGQDDIYFMV